MDEEEIETNAEADHHTEDCHEEGPALSGDIPTTNPAEDDTMKEGTKTYLHAQPPKVVKTKGSRSKKKKDEPPAPAHATAAARPKPELNTHGNPRGQRLCSNCNKIAGHNARTCKKRQMAEKLLEAHQKVYGASPMMDKEKICIRNVLAKQVVGIANNEQLLDTDEDEDYEDQTDDHENEDDVEDYDENEDDQGGEGEEEEQCQTEVTNEQTLEAIKNSKPTPAVPEGQRTCSICKKKASHNSRTCPDKDEILKKQLEEQQNSGDKDREENL
ncbi:high mobility group protein B1 [Brachypodium distachyon]|uniref:high mobility group protein B1 n=1 Tax=Brachypodium distachyon TaxID=15368 RepID=UPI00052FE319|nr:high mobility group protein B1 [Brachypodium distachyon]|eukprot:XP_010240732.1 high mobility group protein B1 [Brachypodium distachyon]